jgi:hypothetical protein
MCYLFTQVTFQAVPQSVISARTGTPLGVVSRVYQSKSKRFHLLLISEADMCTVLLTQVVATKVVALGVVALI